MNVITDGVRDASDMTFCGNPSSSNLLTENTVVTFTCTEDANPPQHLAIWARKTSSEQIAESTGQTELNTQLVMAREYNKVGIFCQATGTDPVYDVDFGDKVYDVQCK